MQTDFANETGKNLTNCASSLPSPTTSTQSSGVSTPSSSSIYFSGTSTPPPMFTTSSSSTNTPSVGAISGGIAGGVLVLICALFVLRRRRRRQRVHSVYPPAEDGEPLPIPDPFMAGSSAPPPYAETLRKGEWPATPSYALSSATALVGSASHSGPSARFDSNASANEVSRMLGGSTDTLEPGAESLEDGVVVAPRAMKLGWRLSEKAPPPDAK
jgi:hypothetical protein